MTQSHVMVVLQEGLLILNKIFLASMQSNSTSNTTYVLIKMDGADVFMIVPSLLITLMLAYFIKRKSACLQFCNGRPGIAIPMNAIDMRHMRLAYLLAFGCVTPTIIRIVLTDKPLADLMVYPSWSTNLIRILAVVLYGTVWYPLFAIINAEIMAGYVLGFLFVTTRFTLHVYNSAVCSTISTNALLQLSALPEYIFMPLMMAYFIYVIVRQFLGRNTQAKLANSKEDEAMAKYVTNVLKMKSKIECQTIKEKVKSCIEMNVPGFIYPPRFLCSLLIAGIVLYVLTIIFFTLLTYLLKWKVAAEVITEDDDRSIYEVFQTIFHYNTSNPDTLKTDKKDAAALIAYFFNLVIIIWVLSTTVASSITLIQFPLILMNYRKNVLLAYKGRYTGIIPPSSMTPSSAISGFSRLVGYQAAYLTWGYLMNWTLLTLITAILTFVFFVPIVNGFGQVWLDLLINQWPSMLTTFAVIVIAKLVTHFAFVDKSTGSIIAITNRSWYCVWAYYLTFYDIFIGFVSCLLRIINSMAIGVFFIGRIDVPVISRCFEKLDNGYAVYSQFIVTEVAHNNPIMRTFLNVLIEEVQSYSGRISSPLDDTSISPIEMNEEIPWREGSQFNRPAFRWHLLYTLHNNPSLVTARKHHIERFQRLLAKKRDIYRRDVEINNEYPELTGNLSIQ